MPSTMRQVFVLCAFEDRVGLATALQNALCAFQAFSLQSRLQNETTLQRAHRNVQGLLQLRHGGVSAQDDAMVEFELRCCAIMVHA
jgi:hypothetical protein